MRPSRLQPSHQQGKHQIQHTENEQRHFYRITDMRVNRVARPKRHFSLDDTVGKDFRIAI